MKGLGGLKPLEMGQSAVQSVGDTAKQQAKQWGQAAATQVTGKTFGQKNDFQQKIPDASAGDFTKLLEQNQTQNDSSGTSAQGQSSMHHPSFDSQKQVQEDQAKITAARTALQELEQEMAEIKQKREQEWVEKNKEEEQEKKMEELQIEEQQKQQPVQAGSPNPEGGKRKG